MFWAAAATRQASPGTFAVGAGHGHLVRLSPPSLHNMEMFGFQPLVAFGNLLANYVI